MKPKSIDRRECTIEKHIALYPLGRIQLQAVKVSDIDSHMSTLMQEGKLSVSSMEKVIDVLNAAYNWAITRGSWSLILWRRLNSRLPSGYRG